MSHDALTRERWEKVWGDAHPDYHPTAENGLRDSLGLIRRFWPEPRGGPFLEAGCGPGANAFNLALEGVEVVGVDLSAEAIRQAQAAFAERSLRGEFVLADVRKLPFPDGRFDFVYAGGVVEHFRDTSQAVHEMARVLRPGGRLLLTAPAFTLSYPYLFLRGNVPAVPGLEGAMSFVQFRLLHGRLATFGYERSFRRGSVRRLLAQAGLVDVEVARFDPYLPVLAVPARLREAARRLARTDLFAPMWYAIGSRPRANG